MGPCHLERSRKVADAHMTGFPARRSSNIRAGGDFAQPDVDSKSESLPATGLLRLLTGIRVSHCGDVDFLTLDDEKDIFCLNFIT